MGSILSIASIGGGGVGWGVLAAGVVVFGLPSQTRKLEARGVVERVESAMYIGVAVSLVVWLSARFGVWGIGAILSSTLPGRGREGSSKTAVNTFIDEGTPPTLTSSNLAKMNRLAEDSEKEGSQSTGDPKRGTKHSDPEMSVDPSSSSTDGSISEGSTPSNEGTPGPPGPSDPAPTTVHVEGSEKGKGSKREKGEGSRDGDSAKKKRKLSTDHAIGMDALSAAWGF